MQRLLLFSLFWLALSLASHPAHAQYPGSGGGGLPGSGGYGSGGVPAWQTTMTSSGTIKATTSSGTQTAAWNTPDESRLSYQSLSGHGQSVTITTKGTYHVEMHWLMPDGSAPPAGAALPSKNVLIDKVGVVGWLGPQDTSDGPVDNGLGSTVSDIPGGLIHTRLDAGELYTVEDGSTGTITYDIPVSATVSSTMDLYGSSYVQVWRNMNVSSNPISLRVHFTTPDSSGLDNILIGQVCKTDVYTPTPQATFQNYHWNVNGDTFASFFMADDESSGHVINCDPILWSMPSPGWCWRDAGGGVGSTSGDGTITVSVDVVVNGQTIKTISDSKQVTVWAPYSKFTYVPTSVKYYPGQTGVIAEGPDIIGQPTPPGITFTGTVGTEDLFIGAGTGDWCFTQIIWLDRKQYVGVLPLPNTTYRPDWLDGSFNYQGTYHADSQSSSSTPHEADDSPNYGFITGNISSFQVIDSFHMYMMYNAPGISQWVPIQSLWWHWNTSGSRNGLTLPPFSPDPPTGSVTGDGAHPDSIFPSWINKYAGSP